MLDVLKFVFSSFWSFAGTAILMGMAGRIVVCAVAVAFKR